LLLDGPDCYSTDPIVTRRTRLLLDGPDCYSMDPIVTRRTRLLINWPDCYSTDPIVTRRTRLLLDGPDCYLTDPIVTRRIRLLLDGPDCYSTDPIVTWQKSNKAEKRKRRKKTEFSGHFVCHAARLQHRTGSSACISLGPIWIQGERGVLMTCFKFVLHVNARFIRGGGVAAYLVGVFMVP
jgi:hypothetical protein